MIPSLTSMLILCALNLAGISAGDLRDNGYSLSMKPYTIVGPTKQACWLYPANEKTLAMACSSKSNMIPATVETWETTVCIPVTQDHLKTKGFVNFPPNAFTGGENNNLGVLCPKSKDPKDSVAVKYNQPELIHPDCATPYMWLTDQTAEWWKFVCKPNSV